MLAAVLAVAAVRPAAADEDVDVLFLGYYVFASEAWRTEMAEKGVHVRLQPWIEKSSGNPALNPLETLKKYHVVVASGSVGRYWGSDVTSRAPEGMVERLLEYVRAGGSVVWTPAGLEKDVDEWNATVGRRIGAEARLGWLTNETTKAIVLPGGGSVRHLALHTHTDDIARHPVTEGVGNLWINPRGEWGREGAFAERYGEGWTTLVRLCGKDLIGVRDAAADGLGRMAVWPIFSAFTWGNYGHVVLGKVFMKDGDGAVPSDGMRLSENLFRWLAEPARKRGLGGAHLEPGEKPKEEHHLDFSLPKLEKEVGHNWSLGREWPGLLGARSALGGGRGSAREWADAAKAAGLKWIAFVDDVTRHTPESYAKLAADCAAATTDDLLVLPGIGGLDTAGYYRYYVGAKRLPPRDSGFLDAKGRFALPHRLVDDSAWDVFGGLAEYGKMPYTAWYPWICATAAVYTYDEQGDLIDDGVDRWALENEWGESYMGPVALVRMNDPKVVADRAKRCHRTVFRGDRLWDAVARGFKSGSAEGAGGIYPTRGPEIVFWGPHGIGRPIPWCANSDMWAFALAARSDVGIVRVEVRDAQSGRTVRDLRYDGVKEVRDFILRETNDRQVSYVLVVTDAAGATAVYPFNSWYPSFRVWYMDDRLMGMSHWLELREDTRKLTGLVGTATGITWNKDFGFAMGMPDNPAPEATLRIDGIDGGRVYAPSQHLEFRLDAAGEQPERYSYLYHQILSAHDVSIQDKDAPYVLAPGERAVFEGCVPKLDRPVVACPRIRAYNLRQRTDSDFYALYYDVEATFLKDVKVRSVFLNSGYFVVQKGDWNQWFLRTAADGEIRHETLPDDRAHAIRGEMRQGGYTYIAPNLGGTAAFLVTDAPGLVFSVEASTGPMKGDPTSVDRSNHVVLRFPEAGGRAFAKGEKLRFGVMMANRRFSPGQETNAWIEKLIADFGVGTGRPGFAYALKRGEFLGCNWFFDVKASEGAARLAIPRNALDQRLPVRVRGLEREAIHGEYNCLTKRVRILPVVPDEGVLLTTYDTAKRETDVMLGDFVRWTEPKAVVTMMPDGLDFLVEVHNPTDAPLKVGLSGNAAFAPFASFRETVDLAPHETRCLKVAAPAGTVSDAVHY